MSYIILPSRRTRQSQGAAYVDRRNAIASQLAFAWCAPLRREILSGRSATTYNVEQKPSAVGVVADCVGEATHIEWASWDAIVGSNGDGSGDLTMSVYANPSSKAEAEHLFVQKNDAAGPNYNQAGLLANVNSSGIPVAGPIQFILYPHTSVTAAGEYVDGKWHLYTGTREGEDVKIYKDGTLLHSVTGTPGYFLHGTPRYVAIGSRGNGTNEAYAGQVAIAYAWNRALSPAEILSLATNPWSLFSGDPRRLYFGAGSVGDTYALTASALAGSSPTLASGVLTQEHALTASALNGAAPTLQSPALTQNHAVTASSIAGSSPILGTPALTLAGTLVANDIAGSAPVLQTPALTQNHSLTATDLAGTAPVLQSPAVTQAHTITASNLTSAAPTLGAPALSASGDSYALAANAITGSAPALALAVLVQDHSLTATAILGASPVLLSPAFGQQHLLTGSNIVAGVPALGTPYLTSGTSGGTGATVEEIVAALQAAVIPVDVAKINGTDVAGSGTDGDPWR